MHKYAYINLSPVVSGLLSLRLFGLCIVCPLSLYSRFWLLVWYLQCFLKYTGNQDLDNIF